MADAAIPQEWSPVSGLDAGKLNRRITIRKRAAGVDALNRPNGAYEDFVTLWADPRSQTGMGRIVNEGVSATLGAYSWRIRYRTDITLDMIVTYEGQDFAIVDIKQDFSGKDWTDLVCSLGTLV